MESVLTPLPAFTVGRDLRRVRNLPRVPLQRMFNSGWARTSLSAQHGLLLPSHPILTSHAPGTR